MKADNIKGFRKGGMDTNSAPQYVDPNDYVLAFNARVTGTTIGEDGDVTNPESALLISQSLPAGINKGIGGGSFEDIGIVVFWRYSSGGKNQMVTYNKDTQVETVIFEDITDTGGETLMPLNPQNYVLAILINSIYMVWVATDLEVGYTNLNTLASGGYGTVLWEDLSLIKPQCMIPPTGTYGSDLGQPANYLFGKLPQFTVQWINADFNYSAWSTRSKRIVPYQQNTPIGGADVTKNNYIIVSVNIGSIRIATINIAARFDEGTFSIVKSVDRTYVVALPDTQVDVDNQIYNAYDPATNLYSFAYYNNDISISVVGTETDLGFDEIWPSNTVEKINGNILSLADWKTLYDRPTTVVAIGAVGYNPNIDIPIDDNPDPLRNEGSVHGGVGSGAGNHRRRMAITLGGTPREGDNIIVIQYDVRDANSTQYHNYIVPPSQDGNLAAVVASTATVLPNSSFYNTGFGTYTIEFIGDPYFELQLFSVQLFFAGATVANSIAAYLDNTVYQAALAYFDKPGRYFPLETNNTFIFNTPSYAQVNGQAIQVPWQIKTSTAPIGAVGYQWLITKPTVTNIIDTLATPLFYKGTWDAYNNSPSLAPNTGTVGFTYQVTSPSNPADPTHYTNLGGGTAYDTGQYVTYNGQSWDVLPKTFGDLTTTGNIIAFSLNPLKMFNDQYSAVGVDTILGYDFSAGDRCTLHYYLDGSGNKVFLNNPCVDLSVIGYDAGTNIVKVEKSATFNIHTATDGKNVFLRLYSPALQNQTASATQNTTVWYETGDGYTITNGQHDTLSGVLYDGGVYYKTRQFSDALQPYSSDPVETLAVDLNYSDFYASAFSSFGRVRAYNDVLESTERKANIITSQPYILGSKNNGLTRFYTENIYGESDGQTSSSQGAIQRMWQRGNVLVVPQEFDIFYIPVNEAYQVLNPQLTGIAISEKLLNNGRYSTEGIGLGLAKEAFCFNKGIGYLVDPHRSEVFEVTTGGEFSISYKMSKYFKQVLSLAYSQGKKIILVYNRYYDEVMMCIEAEGGILTLFPFSNTDWNIYNDYDIIGTDVTATPNGAHSTASYNSTTGLVTYTPTTNYVGSDSTTFTFLVGATSVTKNICLNWTDGSSTPFDFSFAPQTGVPLSTLITSNTVLITGIDFAVPISIVGGSYSINGGAFVTTPGTISNNDTVAVQVLSSASNATETHCDLTVSTLTRTFSVTTIDAGDTAYIFIDNASSGEVDRVNLSVDGVYEYRDIPPHNSPTYVITDGTNYTVSVRMVDASGSFRIYINGVSDDSYFFTRTGMSTPIIVRIEDI